MRGGWRDGGREEGENEREERVLWFGLDWTGLVNELYCSLSGYLAEREGEEEREGCSFFLLM